MKKQVIKFVHFLGGRTAYQGKTQTMFITMRPHGMDIEMRVIERFGFGLPFKMNTSVNCIQY